MRIAQNPLLRTAWQEISYNTPHYDLIGGILENDPDLEAWADNEHLSDPEGFVRMLSGKKVGVIDIMFASPRGEGWGNKTLERFTRQARRMGCDAVVLLVGIYEKNVRALKGMNLAKWYERHGFEHVGMAGGEWAEEGEKPTLPLMVKWLVPQEPARPKKATGTPAFTCQLEIVDAHRDELFGRVTAWAGEDAGAWKSVPDGKGGHTETRRGVKVGYLHFSEYRDEVWVQYVFVDPAWRRKGVATAMYEKVGQEFPGEKITSSGTTGEGGKLRKSLNQKGIVAKAMDYGQVRNVLASLMPDVRGDLPVPELKVVNNIKSRWLGDCRWTIGKPNTVITLQKSICGDDETLRRILAHELAHHEEMLVYWQGKLNEGMTPQTVKMLSGVMGGHGRSWKEVADRWNAKYGKDFVTEKSDQAMVVEYDEKPFYVLLHRYPYGNNNRLWQYSAHLSQKQKELLATPKLQDPGQYKLVETTDRRFLCKAGISPYGGYAIARGPELEAKFDEMWGQPDVREGWLTSVTASSSGGGAMDALLRRINSKDWWHVPPEDPKAYSKRGQFLASTFREAEFWGRPLDAPLHVHVANPLVGDEESILRDLGLGGIPDDAGVAARFFLDARMKQEAEKRGFDSIVLFSPSNYKRFVGQGTVPISIELNVFKPVFAPENKQAAGRAGNVGTAWHGTSEDAAYSIKEKGLVPGKFWGTAYATPDKGLAIYYALGDALGKGLKEGIDPEKEPGRMPDVFLVRIDDPRGAGMDLQPRVGLGDDEIDVYLKRGPVGPQHISAVERYRYKDLLPYLKKRISPTARWQGVKKGISRVPPYRTEGIKKAAARPIRTPALDAWFGNSRVVDAAGRPLVVYHGSKSPWVSSFDLGMAGTSWAGAAGVEKGIWFTSSKDNARFFSDSGPKKKADEASIQGYGKDGEFYAAVFTLREEPIFSVGPYPTIEKAEEEAKSQARMYNRKLRTDTHVMAVYLKIENPLVLDGIVPRKAEFDWAKKNGRDGIIARDVYDGATQSDVYVIFSPSQVKSADRNTGTFDPDDLSITASGKETMPTPEVLDALRRIRGSIRMDESASAAASEGQCGFVSEAASKKFGWGIEGGFYLPDGIPAPHGRRPNFGHLDHVWNVLKDGTVIDGTHDQFGKPDVNVVRPGQPGHEKYHAFCGDPKCPCCACPQCNPDGAKVGSLKKAFVRQDLAWLKSYLTMTDAEKGEELARQFPHRFFEWLSGQELPEGWEAPKDLDELIDNDMFSGLPPAMCEQFLRSDEGTRAVDDDPMDAPSFMYMEYEGIVKNQWLVHKTDEPGEISLHGFTRGMWDLARLGLTTYFTDKAKTGGYNFAVPAGEAGRIERKYGKHAVLFRASGIRIHHYGDEEDQVIFWGRDARDIVPIHERGGEWCLPEGGNGRPVFEAERLQDAVDWAVANFQQYRRWLVPAPTAGKEPKPGSPLLAPKAPVTASARRRVEMPRSPRKYLEGLGLSAGADLKIREWALPDQVEYLNSIKFPLTVYRQLEVPAGKKVNLENVGIYWSDNVDSAQSYWGPSSIWTPSVGGEEGGIVTLRAEVLSEDDVDWEGTLHANAKDPDEDEIRLVPGARIRLTGIEEPKDNDFRTMNKMVTASHKQTPHRENEFPDLGEGEAIGGYGTQPECIDGNRTGLSLEELEEQAKTAATGDWLYHVTYFNRLEDIIWLGLETGHPASIGGLYGWHTKGRSFLTEWRGVGFWYQRAVQWAYHNSDSPVEDGLVPVILRTKEAKRLKVQPDEVGTGDAVADAFFTERSIPAARLQVWDGRQWTRLTEDAMWAMTPEGYVGEADRPLTDPEEREGDDGGYYIDEGALYPKTAGIMEGMPSWEEWKRQHGGIEGMVRDVDSWDQWEPSDVDETREFDALPEEEQAKWIYGNAEEHLKGRYDELLRQHGRWTFPLTVYRMLSLVGGRKAVNPKKIGIFWSWDEAAAEAHWGSFGLGTEKILLKAQVGRDDIDWEGTFEANMAPSTGEEEREIRLKEGVHPLIVAWKKGGYGWRTAPKAWRTMTAFKYDKGRFRTGRPAIFKGYHVTGADGRIKWGEGGAFFSEDPAPEYGTHYVVATLRMANPLVAEDQWDATKKLTGLPGMEDLDKALSDDTGPPQTQEEWARVDRSVARMALRAGHDGLIYTDIAALTDMEFVVFDPSQVTNVGKPVDTQVYVDKLLREMKKDKYARAPADEGKLGAVYLLHFLGGGIPHGSQAATRHYCGFAIDPMARIKRHYEGTSWVRLMEVAKERGISFTVARIWEGVTRGFERKLKDAGGLSRHCPICKAEGTDRGSLYKKKVEVQEAPVGPAAGPDHAEVETSKAASVPKEAGDRYMGQPGRTAFPSKFDYGFVRRIAVSPLGEIAGTLGDLLVGRKVRALYEGVLDVPVVALDRPIQGGKVVENPNVKFFGGAGRFRGEPAMFVNPRLGPEDMIRTILEEGAHILHAVRKRQVVKTDLAKLVDEESFRRYMTDPEEVAAKRMMEHAMILREDAAPWWDVYLDGQKIDSLPAVAADAEEVRRSLVDHDGYDPAIEVRQHRKVASSPPPPHVLEEAGRMLAGASAEACGTSKVVDGWWVETHTIGCRNAADEPEDEWWDSHFRIYDEYMNDGISTVLGEADGGKFATVTPQRSTLVKQAAKALPEFLYHGTTSTYTGDILKVGLRAGTWFSTEPVAAWYARNFIKSKGGKPVVIRIPSRRFRVDGLYQAEAYSWEYGYPIEVKEEDVIVLKPMKTSSILCKAKDDKFATVTPQRSTMPRQAGDSFYPPEADAGWITSYIAKLHRGGVEGKAGGLDYLLKLVESSASRYVLRDIPLEDLYIPDCSTTSTGSKDLEAIREYQDMDAEFPPIVVIGGRIVDGMHRATAAWDRGDETIRAYVGVPSTKVTQQRDRTASSVAKVGGLQEISNGWIKLDGSFVYSTAHNEDAKRWGYENLEEAVDEGLVRVIGTSRHLSFEATDAAGPRHRILEALDSINHDAEVAIELIQDRSLGHSVYKRFDSPWDAGKWLSRWKRAFGKKEAIGDKGWSYDDPLTDRSADFFELVENPHSERKKEAAAKTAAWEGAVDFSSDPRWHDVFYGMPTPRRIKELGQFLRSDANRFVTLYHGTDAGHPVMEEGLLPTSAGRAKSIQSSPGFVYLSVFPGHAKTFGELAYGPTTPIAVYAVTVTARRLLPDPDQLRNKRMYGNAEVGDTLAESLAIGHGARVRGKVDPMQLSVVRGPKKASGPTGFPSVAEVLEWGHVEPHELVDWGKVEDAVSRIPVSQRNQTRKEDEDQTALRILTEQWEAARERLGALRFPLAAYRALSFDSPDWGKEVNKGGFGVYWSLSEDSSYIGEDLVGKYVFVFRGVIESPDDVDWVPTAYLNTVIPEEEEVRLKEGARVRVDGWKARGGGRWTRLSGGMAVTASTPKEAAGDLMSLFEGVRVPSQLPDVDVMREYLSPEALEEYLETRKFFLKLPNPFVVYRALKLDSESVLPRRQDFGVCWTWDFDKARPYGPAAQRQGVRHIFQGEVALEDVDWGYTAIVTSSEEKEIRLRRGARVRLTRWFNPRFEGDGWKAPPYQYVTASASKAAFTDAAMYADADLRDEVAREILDEYKKVVGDGIDYAMPGKRPTKKHLFQKNYRQRWRVVPAARLMKIWKDYAKAGIVRDQAGMDEIADIVTENILKIEVNTILCRHTSWSPEEFAAEVLDHEVPEGYFDLLPSFFDDEEGSWRLSDFATGPLTTLALDLYDAKTAEAKLQVVDKILNIVHQRSDLSGWLVQGGRVTLRKLFEYIGEAKGGENVVWVRDPKGKVVFNPDFDPSKTAADPSIPAGDEEFWKAGGLVVGGVLHPFTKELDTHPLLAKSLGLEAWAAEGAIRVTTDWLSRCGCSAREKIYMEVLNLGQKQDVISLLRDHPPPAGVPITLEWGGYLKMYREFDGPEVAIEWLENLGGSTRVAARAGDRIGGQAVVDYVMSQHPEWKDRTYAEQLVGLDAGGDYVLKEVSLQKLEAGDDYDPSLAEKYARMETPIPPIVMDGDGRIRDGNHRVAAGKIRGDKAILAYVPVDSYQGLPTGKAAAGKESYNSLMAGVGMPSQLPAAEEYERWYGDAYLGRYQEFREFCNGLPDPLVVYRAVKMPDRYPYTRGFGIYWTWDEGHAVPYDADSVLAEEGGWEKEDWTEYSRGLKTYVFRGEVALKDVDWASTVWANLRHSDEKEVTLRHDAPVRVTGWKLRGSSRWQRPKYEHVTASKTTVAVTDSPQFRAWFGKSKVVNPDGTPMVMYHGSPRGKNYRPEWVDDLKKAVRLAFDHMGKAYPGDEDVDKRLDGWVDTMERFDKQNPGVIPEEVMGGIHRKRVPFEAFNPGMQGRNTEAADAKVGFFFTPDQNFAQRFTYRVEYDPMLGQKRIIDGYDPHVFEVYLRIENPLDLTVKTKANAQALLDSGLLGPREELERLGWGVEGIYKDLRSADGSKSLQQIISRHPERIRGAGYDGIINRVKDQWGKSNVEYVVFSPDQIKAVDSKGFDPSDRRMTASKTAAPESIWYHGTTPAAAKDIEKDGLVPPALKADYTGGAGGGHIYISTDRRVALGWGLRKARQENSKRVALVLFRPTKGVQFLDRHNPDVSSLEGTIPATAVTGVEFYDTKAVAEAISTQKPIPPKLAAPKSVWYHGSSIKNLRSILKQGLIPDPKERNWGEDAAASAVSVSRVSYGGTYVARNLMTAASAPKDHNEEGREVVVCMELQPNTMYLDEDDVVFYLSHPLGRLSDNTYYSLPTFLGKDGSWKEFADAERRKYVEDAVRGLAFKWKMPGEDKGSLHPGMEERLRALLPEAWEAALLRIAAHEAKRSKPYDLRHAYHKAFPYVEYDSIPDVQALIPSPEEGEAAFRDAVEKITRALRQFARPLRPGEAYNRDTARITEPIGYSGSNRILAVVEVRDGRKYKGDDWKNPTVLVIHYGEIPPDFFAQFKERYGGEFVVEQAHQPGKAADDGTILLFRGEGGGSKKGGRYWSPDEAWAAQFTQTGRTEELRRARMRKDGIFHPAAPPYAGDPDAIDVAVQDAKARGCKAVWLDEGRGQPESVYVFDGSALRKAAAGEWWRRWRKTQVLPRGTVLYHGTSQRFDPSGIEMPAWFSTSESVAEHFQDWHGGEESGKVLRYKVICPIRLPRIDGKEEMEKFCEMIGVNMEAYGSEDIVDAMRNSSMPGWIIPDNYPDGDDILLASRECLEALDEEEGKTATQHGGPFLKLASGTWQEAERIIRSVDPGSQMVLFHAGTADEDASIVEQGVRAQMGKWVEECLQGATDSEDAIQEIKDRGGAAYFDEMPRWIRSKVRRAVGHDPTPDDIRRHGQLTIVVADLDGPIQRYLGEDRHAGPEVQSLRGERNVDYDLPFGLEPGDYFSEEDVAADITLVGDDLVRFMERNYPREMESPSRRSLPVPLKDAYESVWGPEKTAAARRPKLAPFQRSGWLEAGGRWHEYDDRQMAEAGHGDSAVDFGLVGPVWKDEGLGYLDQEATMGAALEKGHVAVRKVWGKNDKWEMEAYAKARKTVELALARLPAGAIVEVTLYGRGTIRDATVERAAEWVRSPMGGITGSATKLAFPADRTVSPQDAVDRGMFGPVWHGTTPQAAAGIDREGFKVFEGEANSAEIQHGYEGKTDYALGLPAPVHHLGYGIYFTTSKAIAKAFNGGTTRGLRSYYLDVPRLETINFGSPNTMMKWWIKNGYSPEVARVDRVAATKMLTDSLKSRFDAVWYKGMGIRRLLDGDQVAVFDPSRIYLADPSLARPGDMGSEVVRKADGMRGVVKAVRRLTPEQSREFHGGAERLLTVTWRKGGTDYNVYDRDVEPLQAGKKTSGPPSASSGSRGLFGRSNLQGLGTS